MASLQRSLGVLQKTHFLVPSRKISWTKRLQEILNAEYSIDELKIVFKKRILYAKREDQKFRPDRHKILGPELAVSHFLLARGGTVKFENDDKWYHKEKNKIFLPRHRVKGLFVEAICADNTELMYEGLDNFVGLKSVRYLSLKNCAYIDDYCLDRLHIMADTLQFLDLSGCTNITERGLATLHKMGKLEALILRDIKTTPAIELVTLMLQDVLPECHVLLPTLMKEKSTEVIAAT